MVKSSQKKRGRRRTGGPCKQGGFTMLEIEMRYVGGHVEVYSGAGVFLFSADTVREAMAELAD